VEPLSESQLPRCGGPIRRKRFSSKVPPDSGIRPGLVQSDKVETGRPGFVVRGGGEGKQDEINPVMYRLVKGRVACTGVHA